MATAPVVTATTGRHVGAPLRSSSRSPFGLWYGKKSSSSFLPTTDQLIHLYKVNNIQKMWLCCETPEDGLDILQNINSDREANIEVVLYISTPEVRRIALGEMEWIRLITEYQPVISYVCLGNVGEMANNDFTMIGSAMDKIHSINPISFVKVSTLVDVNSIFGSYEPTKSPSSYTFPERFKKVLIPVFERLGQTYTTPLFVKTFPNFAIRDNIEKRRIGLDNYLLEECARPYMTDNQTNLEYKYVFDAMVDSISSAKTAMGQRLSNVDISVVSGWPTAGSNEARIEYAQKYNDNLLRHVNEDTPRKTKRMDHFIFSVRNEDLLTTNDDFDWNHFGTFTLWKKETFPPTEMDGSA